MNIKMPFRSQGQPQFNDLCVRSSSLYFRGQRFAFALGRFGRTDQKCEGDLASPRGVHQIAGVYYRADRIAKPCAWAQPILPRDGWSDDVNDPCYNHKVKRPHGFSHERLWRADSLYDLVVNVAWNWPHATPGHGSAIFIHQWRSQGFSTAGCIALRRDHLHHVVGTLTPKSRLIVY